MRYRVESHPNRDMKTIHVDALLFSGHFGPHYKFSEYEKLDEEDRALVDAVVAVPGVREAYFSAYQVAISKGGVFPWDEVLDPVLAVLEGRYGEPLDVGEGDKGDDHGHVVGPFLEDAS